MISAADRFLVPPTILRGFMLAETALTGVVAVAVLVALLLTALFGGEGESSIGLAVIAGGIVLVLLHAVGLGSLLLRVRHSLVLSWGVFLGGLGLLAVSGAAVVGAELDDSPGGVLAGLLLAAHGATAALALAFPQLVPQRPLR